MRLKALLQDVETNSIYTANEEITNITDNADNVKHSGLFVCISGENSDGHNYVRKALEKGACAIISEKEIGCDNCIVVDDTRKAYAAVCGNFYSNRHRDLTMIGITGTNGKTTTSYILKKILEDNGYRVGLIGTVSVVIGNEKYPADLTTPNPADLHRYIMMMYAARCDVCIMEVSSQALAQQRTYGINFHIGIFTNLSPEHLDYHKSIEEYAQAKAVLMQNSDISLINADDTYSALMYEKSKAYVAGYGIANGDMKAENIRLSADGNLYNFRAGDNVYSVKFSGLGLFSVYNSLAALSAAKLMNVNMDRAVRSVAEFEGIAGRMEKIENDKNLNVIVDYAHTPDSLKNVLEALRQVYGGNLITVFGCGGDRDKTKRPVMGRIACEYSDRVYVTSDNPRTENPDSIIDDIMKSTDGFAPVRIADRTTAIRTALNSAEKGDTVLVAGKGHEKYQVIGKDKIYYNEREIIKQLLKEVTEK